MDTTDTPQRPWSKGRGFASMTPERRREVARSGGRKGHQLGVAHRWTSEEAAEAGRKGGKSSRRPAAKKQSSELDA